MNEDQAQNLLRKYHEGTATPEEKEWLEAWLMQYRQYEESSLSADELKMLKNEVWEGVSQQTSKKTTTRLWLRIAAAASILLVLSFGGYFLFHRGAPETNQVAQTHDVTPGSNSATLTLSNGQQIVLNSIPPGQIAMQGPVAVSKNANGQLQYSGQATELLYNIVVTKRKEQYDVVLSDGTHVWLNAESSLKYPAAFNGTERKVELIGEAYFEVAHHATMPFKVKTNGQTVEVLGTHFNISSYTNEAATKTTLLQGSVKIIADGSEQKIKPGQQGLLTTNGLQVKDADTELAVAWHHGDFLFKGEKIEPIMRQLSRWYDIDVVYQGKPTTEGFYAGISRFKNISQVLGLLEQSKGVHFKIEGRSVTVMP